MIHAYTFNATLNRKLVGYLHIYNNVTQVNVKNCQCKRSIFIVDKKYDQSINIV